jgi:hypothetical protein
MKRPKPDHPLPKMHGGNLFYRSAGRSHCTTAETANGILLRRHLLIDRTMLQIEVKRLVSLWISDRLTSLPEIE